MNTDRIKEIQQETAYPESVLEEIANCTYHADALSEEEQ